MDFAFIPSPSRSVIELGPIPLRGYAFCIIIGVFVAIWLGNRRWIARGGQKGTVADIAVWAVPFGLVGGRLYHVLTSYEVYFGEGRNPVDALKIWEGGLGIWGAIALGAVGAWIGCRRRGIPLPAYADAVAPGIALAQAIGRWGNWFNQELYGKPTDLPWAVRIDEEHRPPEYPDVATYHPTFLYEFLWCIGVALLVIWADRRFRLGHGRAFALYVAAYTVGRFWVEYLRIDEAHHILGLRLNNWTSLVVFIGAVLYIVISARRRPGREDAVEPAAAGDGDDGSAAEAVSDGSDSGSAEQVEGAEQQPKDAGPDGAGKSKDARAREGEEGEQTGEGGGAVPSEEPSREPSEDKGAAAGGEAAVDGEQQSAPGEQSASPEQPAGGARAAEGEQAAHAAEQPAGGESSGPAEQPPAQPADGAQAADQAAPAEDTAAGEKAQAVDQAAPAEAEADGKAGPRTEKAEGEPAASAGPVREAPSTGAPGESAQPGEAKQDKETEPAKESEAAAKAVQAGAAGDKPAKGRPAGRRRAATGATASSAKRPARKAAAKKTAEKPAKKIADKPADPGADKPADRLADEGPGTSAEKAAAEQPAAAPQPEPEAESAPSGKS